MNKLTIYFLLVFFLPVLADAQFNDLNFGSDSTLDVVTWNIEHFPKSGQTPGLVKEIILAMNVDIVAIQEVTSENELSALADDMPGWNYFYTYNKYAALAYLYSENEISEIGTELLFANKSREFPRSPLMISFTWNGQRFHVINNHLKCCGDQEIDLNDDWDEEKRRYDACVLFDEYIKTNLNSEKVIILGDLNDLIDEAADKDVFAVFNNTPAEYEFADMAIAIGSSTDWSYPSWPSHLDHILITNELFDDIQRPGAKISTLKPDLYFENGWSEYDNLVSDHRPVAISIKSLDYSGLEENIIPNIQVFPQPATDIIYLNSDTEIKNISLFKINGQLVYDEKISRSFETNLNVSCIKSGVYVLRIIDINDKESYRKIIISGK